MNELVSTLTGDDPSVRLSVSGGGETVRLDGFDLYGNMSAPQGGYYVLEIGAFDFEGPIANGEPGEPDTIFASTNIRITRGTPDHEAYLDGSCFFAYGPL